VSAVSKKRGPGKPPISRGGGSAARVTVTLPREDLAAIDAQTKNRSGWIQDAVRRKLRLERLVS